LLPVLLKSYTKYPLPRPVSWSVSPTFFVLISP
jgi:hypothetical protein